MCACSLHYVCVFMPPMWTGETIVCADYQVFPGLHPNFSLCLDSTMNEFCCCAKDSCCLWGWCSLDLCMAQAHFCPDSLRTLHCQMAGSSQGAKMHCISSTVKRAVGGSTRWTIPEIYAMKSRYSSGRKCLTQPSFRTTSFPYWGEKKNSSIGKRNIFVGDKQQVKYWSILWKPHFCLIKICKWHSKIYKYPSTSFIEEWHKMEVLVVATSTCNCKFPEGTICISIFKMIVIIPVINMSKC